MKRLSIAITLAISFSASAWGTSPSASETPSDPSSVIDAATLDKWSAPYRGWYYYPDHVIPAKPRIKGLEEFVNTDVPTVFQLPGDDRWYMSFIAFDGQGYNSFIAESTDLIHWGNMRLAMGFGPKGEFDRGGRVLGAYLYESQDIKAPRLLKRREGKFWSLYGAYPRQGGYELRPGYEGLAWSEDGKTWQRAGNQYILSVHDADCGTWEKDCIYQPWLVEHKGKFFDFYNAASGRIEQTGVAFSSNLLDWKRHPENPIVRNTPGGYDEVFCSDPKVFRDGDHWTMFYFGVGRGGAHIMAAFSRDLIHWTKHPEPIYKAGGHPGGLDKKYAHKISLVFNPRDKTFYMFYCAVGVKGRGIGLITSSPIKRSPNGSEGCVSRSLSEIRIRDPFILPEKSTKTYYMYAQMGNRLGNGDPKKGVEVYTSKDLEQWEGPLPVFTIPEGYWADRMVWAPEVHRYKGKYYLFVTFTSKATLKAVAGRPSQVKRGTQVLVADSPLGPFKPFHNRAHTPSGWMALDGTLWVEDSCPWMIFCHEWVQTTDGTMDVVRLKPDLSDVEGAPTTLFKASDSPWVRNLGGRHPGYVTDGPFLYRTKENKLLMIWSSFGVRGYAVGLALSTSGEVAGPWKQVDKPLFEANGGHGMIFKTFDGRLMLVLHQPNSSPKERARFFSLEDTGDLIRLTAKESEK